MFEHRGVGTLEKVTSTSQSIEKRIGKRRTHGRKGNQSWWTSGWRPMRPEKSRCLAQGEHPVYRCAWYPLLFHQVDGAPLRGIPGLRAPTAIKTLGEYAAVRHHIADLRSVPQVAPTPKLRACKAWLSTTSIQTHSHLHRYRVTTPPTRCFLSLDGRSYRPPVAVHQQHQHSSAGCSSCITSSTTTTIRIGYVRFSLPWMPKRIQSRGVPLTLLLEHRSRFNRS